MAVLLGEPPAISPVQIDEFEDRRECETFDGIDVERPPTSVLSRIVASDLSRALCNYGIDRKLGKAYSEVKIALPGTRVRNRIPDVIFVPFNRWAADRKVPKADAWPILPDLCVEVTSPSDLSQMLDAKVLEYFAAGVGQVWVVNPELALVHVYESLDRARILQRGQTLAGIDFLPGFELPLAELFLEDRPPEA